MKYYERQTKNMYFNTKFKVFERLVLGMPGHAWYDVGHVRAGGGGVGVCGMGPGLVSFDVMVVFIKILNSPFLASCMHARRICMYTCRLCRDLFIIASFVFDSICFCSYLKLWKAGSQSVFVCFHSNFQRRLLIRWLILGWLWFVKSDNLNSSFTRYVFICWLHEDWLVWFSVNSGWFSLKFSAKVPNEIINSRWALV